MFSFLCLQELFDEYNAQLYEIRKNIELTLSEAAEMFANGEVTEEEYKSMVGLVTVLFGGFMPEMVFCEGHEKDDILPDVPDEPEMPKLPEVNPDVIIDPSTDTIDYGDSIILRVDKAQIPEGGYVVWSVSNENFSYDVSDDGITCTITPKKSGDTTFTVTVYDSNKNAVSTDEQQMTSKAGLFMKILAFFKKLFGLTKIFNNAIKY